MSADRDKVVLVTGAAGGLGVAIARRFVADGAQVAMTDVAAERLHDVAAELGALALPADGTDRSAVEDVVDATVAALGGLDTVIAAQGATSSGGVNSKGADAWLRALDINLTGTFFVASASLPHLIARRGSIVMISSSAGISAGPAGTAGYTAAKSGLIGLMRWLAREFGPKGVRVNAVCPGWMRSRIGEDAMAYLAQRDGITKEEAYRLATAHVPLRRPAEPEEIAAICAFLASSDASIVTGHTLVADGGASIVDMATTVFDPPIDGVQEASSTPAPAGQV
jgi:NAD(P)-dependent dehydrogenase (short-subunit alcohol dehydrogenase family)